MGSQLLDYRVHRLSGFDHKQNAARALERGGEFRNCPGSDDILAPRASVRELLGFFRRPVVDGDWKPVALEIERQVFAHHCQSNHAEFLHIPYPQSASLATYLPQSPPETKQHDQRNSES